MKEKWKWPLISVGAFVVVAIFNILGVMGTINGMSQKMVSEKYPTLITPAGYAFSIWSVIYLLVIAFLVFSFLEAKEDRPRLHIFFWVSCACNVLWIIFFSLEWMFISVLAIFGLLFSLLFLNKEIVKREEGRKRLIDGIAFGIYSGWVLAATFVNVSAFLVSTEWKGFGLPVTLWAILSVLIAVGVFFLVVLDQSNVLISLTGAWAFLAMFVARLQDASKSILLMIVLVLATLFMLFVSFRQYVVNDQSLLPKSS